MRSVKVLRVDSQKVSNGEKKNVESRQVCKTMNGRAYMASLKQKSVISADHQKEQNMQTKPSHCNDSNWSGKIDGGDDNINKREEFKIENVVRTSEATLRSSSTGTKFVTEALNHNVAEFSCARQKHISGEEASGHEAGNVGITMTSPPNDSRGDRIDLESDRETTSVKRKRESADTDSDNAAVIGKISDCTSTADLPSSSFCLQSHSVKTCSICFKRQRINDDSMNPGFCSCTKLILLSRAFIDVYGVVHEEPEASGSIETFENCKNSEKQKESSADFGTNINLNACFACKLGGKLLCCNAKGCRRNFHLSCLDPPLEDVPFGVWHCLACLKRKIEFGVHSVSEGVESVWDSREVDLSDADGLSRQRQYFIKYRDLAHVHNRWVLERELLAEDSSLLSKYDSKSQWKQEWSMPHRLLQKRFLVSPLHSGENGGLPASEKLGLTVESGVTVESIRRSNDSIAIPKERFSRHIASLSTSRFVEYWVPAQLSHVQLEQYCFILLANTTSLRSLSRKDHVGALSDILVSAKKCCNHPYILDPSLQTLLTSGLEAFEFLDVGIKASGKLQLLDVMLMQMKKQGLRVLILFKSNSGSGRDSIGDILDDFLRQRFGADSYEYVEGGLLPSKKLAALKKFNDNGLQRFVFLLEFRACLPSIKLSSVDSIIIYDSDWTSMNDLRALKKITIEPQFDHIKVFRLYLSCTMEEKVLMLASQNKIIDTSLQNISLPTSHMLLTWGASHLFDNLEKFHKSNISSLTAATSAKESHLQDVMHDLVSILSQKDGSSGTQDLHIMLKAQQVKGSYHTDHSLLGELKIPQTQESSPHLFWSQLLEGRRPQWRFCSEASHWTRKRSRKLNNELPEKSYLESEKIAKTHKKVSTSDICQTSLKAGLEGENTDREKNDGFEILETMSPFSHTATGSEDNLLHENNAPFLSNETDNIKGIFEDDMAVLDGEKEFGDKQKSLHHLLLPRILTLCQILQFPENVKCAVQKLLVHVINNHHISQESESILQAFQISLCWTAAYWIKYKICHKESMALAKEKLNFDCKKEDAYYIYSKLRCLKNMFVSNASEKKVAEAPLVPEELSVDNMQNIPETQLAASFNLKTVAVEVNDLFKNQKDKQDVLLPEMCPEFNLADKDELQRVKVIQKKCRELLSELINKQQEDKDEVKKNNEEMKLRLEKNYRMESAVIRSLHGNNPMGAAKLKILENVYAKKIKEQKTQTEIRLKDLEVEHLAARNKVQEKEAQMVEESKSRAQVELLNKQSLNETRHEHSQYVSRSNVGEECPVVENLQEFREKVSKTLETIHEEAVEGQSSVSIDTCRRTVNHNDDVVELGIVSKGASGAEFDQPDNINSSSNALEIAMTANPCSLDQESRAPVSSCTPDGDNTAEILGPAITNDCVENVLPLQPTISAILNSERNSLSLPDKDVPCKQIGIDNLREVPDRVLISSLPLFEKEIINGASTGRPDVEGLQELPESMGFNITLDHVVPINQEQNPSEAILIMPNEEFPLGVSSSIPENLLLVDQPTLGAQIPTDIIITIPDEEILPQTREGAFAHATEDNGRNCQINFIDISVSDYDFEINQSDNLSNDNNHIIHSNEMSHANLLTLTRGSPLPSNQDLCTLPFSYPVSLVDPLTLLQSIELSSACFNSDLPMFSGVEHYQSNEERSFSQNHAQLPRCSDPLQSELDRISKEAEECIKINDDKKAQLSSDCEKEIEEVIARIRNKYDAKLREAEADHILRMKKLDENYYKVRMNKCLADAFMSICVDPTLPEPPAYQLDRTSTLPLQQHRTQQIAQRPPLPIRVPTTSPSVTLPAGSLQPISPAPPSAHPSPMINHSTPPAKPPFISSISYCMANPQVGGTIRFPAPHLQPFRPSTSTPPSLPCHTTSLQGPRSSLLARTPLYPQLGPQLPEPSISSLSPLGLAMDVNRRAGVGLPNLTDVCLNVDLPSTLPAGTANSTDINLRENGGPGIFCLSDDD